jgi:hypothetical protein
VKNIDNYYVYEHIRLDNNTCFYVGKGHGKRYKYKSRNEHHDRIANKYGMKSVIVKDNLSEEEAYKLERDIIAHYVFDLNYGIDIQGYRNYSENKFLTNHTFGGDGSYGMVHSDEWRRQHSIDMTGKNNPMYGINLWETYSDDKSNEIKDKIRNAISGENNPSYGISPKERMSEEKYKEWYKKTSDRLKSQTGSNNPNYGNKTLHNKVKYNPELRIQYYSRKGSQNGRSKKVYVYKNNEFIKEFSYIGECCEWLKEMFNITTKIDSIRNNIKKHIKDNTEYKGFKFYFSKQI